jgi:hypothetical protein
VTNNVVRLPSDISSVSDHDVSCRYVLCYLDRNGAEVKLEVKVYNFDVDSLGRRWPNGWDTTNAFFKCFEETRLKADSGVESPPGDGWIFHHNTDEWNIFRRRGDYTPVYYEGREFDEIVVEREWGKTVWPRGFTFVGEDKQGDRWFRSWPGTRTP